MKMGYCLGMVLILVAALMGCRNRFETYEPYSTFDDRMAAANADSPYPQDAYSDQYNIAGDERDVGQSGAPAEMSGQTASASQNAEVPFASSRGVKHAMNIGAS